MVAPLPTRLPMVYFYFLGCWYCKKGGIQFCNIWGAPLLKETYPSVNVSSAQRGRGRPVRNLDPINLYPWALLKQTVCSGVSGCLSICPVNFKRLSAASWDGVRTRRPSALAKFCKYLFEQGSSENVETP